VIPSGESVNSRDRYPPKKQWQWVGREEFFECEREMHPDFYAWDGIIKPSVQTPFRTQTKEAYTVCAVEVTASAKYFQCPHMLPFRGASISEIGFSPSAFSDKVAERAQPSLFKTAHQGLQIVVTFTFSACVMACESPAVGEANL